MALTLEPPAHEATHWTLRAIAKAVGIAASSGVKIWHDHRLAPHRWRSFKLSNDQAFAEKLHDVVGLYVSALTHHPHVHMIVPGGGIALDGTRWISSRPAFLLPVRVLGALFRRLFLTRLLTLFDAGKLGFFGTMARLATRKAFLRYLSPVQKMRWVVYAKPPFAGPQAVLAYLSRYTHRVAISNRRLITFNESGVTFRYKDYRRDGVERQQVMALATDEFIRRSLIHVLPRGFHRIRHYGLLSSSARKASHARAAAP